MLIVDSLGVVSAGLRWTLVLARAVLTCVRWNGGDSVDSVDSVDSGDSGDSGDSVNCVDNVYWSEVLQAEDGAPHHCLLPRWEDSPVRL